MTTPSADAAAALLAAYSIEVLPRTADKVADFRAILPPGTRVYLAHVPDADHDEMVKTAKRIVREGFPVMPHVPARAFKSRQALEDLLARYAGEADIQEALVIAGGQRKPAGPFAGSLDLLDTGLFERCGFRRLFFAGHPEGNRDIDRDGSGEALKAALAARQAIADTGHFEVALVTQFSFDAAVVVRWIAYLRASAITLPVHVGIAGPAKLQTLIKYAALCGVGASANILRTRAGSVTQLIRPFDPAKLLDGFLNAARENPASAPARIHFFPFGGVERCALFANAWFTTAQANPASPDPEEQPTPAATVATG
ncbi:MAG: methylenetetrahydrofolate reductase [Pseudomonadota bacterium]